MAKLRLSNKPLTVNPLKVSQPMGATLALLGVEHSMPLQHGAQGCTAFSKVFFTRHFREPIPLQTTAMDQVSTILGADQNVLEALRVISAQHQPEVIGLISTGLSETQGADIQRAVKEFRANHPECMDVSVVPISTPDALGCLESGYAKAVEALIQVLVPESTMAGYRAQQVNVLLSSMLTPGDVEAIRQWVAAFGLRPVMLPDLGAAMDGHFDQQGFTTLSAGGVSRVEIATMGKSAATLVIGPSLFAAAELLKRKTQVPDYRFNGLLGLEACDQFIQALASISGREVPASIERQRLQLLDAMVDTHALVGAGRVAVASEPDHIGMLVEFLHSVGSHVVAAVSSSRAESLERLALDEVIVGDLQDLEDALTLQPADVLLSNSHAQTTAQRLGLELLPSGFPQYDYYGGYARQWVGYRGTRQLLFDLANAYHRQRREVTPYRSLYWANTPRAKETSLDMIR